MLVRCVVSFPLCQGPLLLAKFESFCFPLLLRQHLVTHASHYMTNTYYQSHTNPRRTIRIDPMSSSRDNRMLDEKILRV